ncbi:MAG: hypothetical protein IPN94_10995 [Sphingobacteriales bacterium]|nr:hypothetical protein [Sphingobacteriales bacterium]
MGAYRFICQTINPTEPDPTLCNADFSVEALVEQDTQNVIFNNQSIEQVVWGYRFGDNTENLYRTANTKPPLYQRNPRSLFNGIR